MLGLAITVGNGTNDRQRQPNNKESRDQSDRGRVTMLVIAPTAVSAHNRLVV